MFPEYREVISALKGNHKRFDSLFEKHNKLDHEIKELRMDLDLLILWKWSS